MNFSYQPEPNWNADRNEDGTFCAAGDRCENCNSTGFYDAILTDDGQQLLLCDDCIGEQRRIEAQASALAIRPVVCEEREQIVNHASSVGELLNRLRGHDVVCSQCGSGKRTVQSDRLWLDLADSSCCGEVA